MITLNSLNCFINSHKFIYIKFKRCFHKSQLIYLDEIEKAFKRKNYNPKDQFGTLSRDRAAPQIEKLQSGFENPWLKTIEGEEILKQEIKYARKKWELNVDKFENAPQITIPFRATKKINRQKQKEIKEYKKLIQKN